MQEHFMNIYVNYMTKKMPVKLHTLSFNISCKGNQYNHTLKDHLRVLNYMISE